MPEIDLRNNPWNPGVPHEPVILYRDLYHLLAFFSASREISQRRSGGDDKGSVYGYSIRYFELTEIGRLLVSLAASSRNRWEYDPYSIEDDLKLSGEASTVGVLIRDLKKPASSSELLVRESWNKILHCHTINFQRSEGPSIYSGHLEPFVHVYGEHRGSQWKATIDIFRWCEVMHALT